MLEILVILSLFSLITNYNTIRLLIFLSLLSMLSLSCAKQTQDSFSRFRAEAYSRQQEILTE